MRCFLSSRSWSRFQRALTRARRFAGAPGLAALVDRLPVRDGARTILVPLDDILWLEAQGNYVGVHTAAATHLLRDTLSALETRLDPARFLRVQRGAMVRLGAVAELITLAHGDGVLRLASGGEVPVGRTYRERVLAALRQSV